jgi:hypothetical protein
MIRIDHGLFGVVIVALSACNGPLGAPSAGQEVPMTLSISSSAFAAGAAIPAVYTCRGKGISPPIAWSGAPETARSLALIMDDPDAPAGTFVHWVIYNLPATATGLPESVPGAATLPDGSLQGSNSARRTGYTAPCPPSGTHRYFFKVYALDSVLELASGANKEALLKAMQGHILTRGELMGTVTK